MKLGSEERKEVQKRKNKRRNLRAKIRAIVVPNKTLKTRKEQKLAKVYMHDAHLRIDE